MDEVSAKAKLATAEPGLTVSVPKREVVAALEGEGADLVLDVVHTNGDRRERRVTLAMEQETLKQLVDEADGEQVLIAIDPASLASAFDDVEAHGLREMGATLAIVVTAVAGGAGVAQAYPADGTTPAGGAQAATAATISPHDGTGVVVAATATPDTGGYHQFSGQLPSAEATAEVADRGIENVRAAQPAPAETPDAMSGIENVRAGAPMTPEPSSAIEQVRTGRVSPAVDEGSNISAPSAGVTAALAGGAALTIAAAAFALRRTREPRPA